MSDTDHYDEHGAGEEWGTPRGIVNPIANAIGGFDLDPASGAEPEPYADERFTREDDGLAKDWHGDVWLNPPYGRGINIEWAEKAVDEYYNNDEVDRMVILAPAATGTLWFGRTYANADILTFIHRRVAFVDADDAGGDGVTKPTFGSVIAGFGWFPVDYRIAMEELTDAEGKDLPTTTYQQRQTSITGTHD